MRHLNRLAGIAGVAMLLLGALAATPSTAQAQGPELGPCQNLTVSAPFRLTFHAYANGAQVYRWDGSSWVFLGPVADLYANEGETGQVGTHYAGPTWESVSGSNVVGRLIDKCPADPTAIPWLVLEGVYSAGPGIFNGVKRIQRVNTTGGTAPVTPGSTVGEIANVPYTAEYYFYK